MDLLYPYIPKWVQSTKAIRSYDVIKTCRTWKLRFFAENRQKISKNSKFRYKSSEYQNFTGCLVYSKGKWYSNMFCKFQHHSMQIFFFFSKWRIFLFLKLKRFATTPLTLWLCTVYPTPGERWYPQFFFHENDRKGCTKRYTYEPLVTFFSVLERPGKTVRGVAKQFG